MGIRYQGLQFLHYVLIAHACLLQIKCKWTQVWLPRKLVDYIFRHSLIEVFSEQSKDSILQLA